MDMVRFAVVGTSAITARFLDALALEQGAALHAVYSRTKNCISSSLSAPPCRFLASRSTIRMSNPSCWCLPVAHGANYFRLRFSGPNMPGSSSPSAYVL